MPKIRFGLNKNEIQRAIREAREYQKKVEEAGEKIAKELSEEGAEIARQNASYMSIYDTGELVNGIKSLQDGETGYVASTAPHSRFCEFGTGIRGKQNPHPEPGLVGWKYDVNEHGEEGWFYQGDDGNWHWTAGMPSRPYMYETKKALEDRVEAVVKEALK